MTTTPTTTETAEPPRKNVLQRIAGVLFAPAETFADIARRPTILGPALVLLIVGYLSTAIAMPRFDFDALTAMQREKILKQNPQMAEKDLERMDRYAIAGTKVFVWCAPVLMFAWYAIVAAVLLFAFRLMGGEGTYKQAYSATLYAWMPMLILGIIGSIVVIARGSFDPTTAQTLVKSNPAFLVEMKEQPVLFSFLASFDLFGMWMVVLLAFGFAALSRMRLRTALAIVIPLWLAFVLVRLGFTAMGAARMG